MPERLSHLRVLVADDHYTSRQMVINVLRKYQIETADTASNGHEAKQAIYAADGQKRPYHIVFLDRDMPLLNGIDVLAHFREQHAFDKMAFIMLTAEADQDEVLRAIKTGATTYIVKPTALQAIEKKLLGVVDWLDQKNPGLFLK